MKNGSSILSVLVVLALVGMAFAADSIGAADSTGAATTQTSTTDSTDASVPPSSTTETPAPGPAPSPAATGCTITPSSASVSDNTATQFTASCTTSGGASDIACPPLYWTSTIGTISGSGSTATHNSGIVSGTGTVKASSMPSAVQAAGAKMPLGADTTGTGVLVAAALVGTTTSAPSSGFSCTASVKVSAAARVPTSVSVVPSSAATTVGGTIQFSVHIYDQNGLEMKGLPVTWSTSAMIAPTPVATTATASALVTGGSAAASCGSISSTGLFTGSAAGSCKVAAKVSVSTPAPSPTPTANALATAAAAGYITGEATVSVSGNSNPVPTTVVVSPASASVYVNGQQALTATVYDQFGAPMGTTVAWSITAVSTPAPLPTPTANALTTAPSAACGTIAPDATSRSPNAAIFTARIAGKCRVVAKAAVATPAPSPTTTANALTTAAVGTSYIEGSSDVTVLASLATVPTTVVVSPSPVSIAVGARQQFSAKVYDQNGVEITSAQKVTWSVTSAPTTKTGTVATASALLSAALAPTTACGTVDSTGTFTARTAGSCRVVAKVPVASTKVATTGVITTASALISAALGTTGYIQGYADVSVVAASTGGTPTSVVVVAASPPSVGVASDSAAAAANNRYTIKRNTKTQLKAYVYDQNGNLMEGVPVHWSVQTESVGDALAPSIGTIDQNGIFVGKLAGLGKVMATVFVSSPALPTTANALITAKTSGATAIQGTLDIQVVSDVQASSMTCTIVHPNRERDMLKVRVNSNTQLSASCATAGGATEVVCPALDWSSTIGNVYSITVVGDVTFNSGSIAGSGSVTATGGDPVTGDVFTCSLPVTVASGVPTSISVSPSSATVQVGGQQQFSAIVRDEFGNEMPEMGVLWTLETLSIGTTATAANSQIGKISSSGLFAAGLTGTGYAIATLAAPSPDAVVSGKAKIQVVESISKQTICVLDPASAQLKVGQQQTFNVNCMSADGSSDIACPPMSWSSTIGSISPSPDSSAQAIFASKATGTGVVTAMATAPSVTEAITCSAKVAVGSGEQGGMPSSVNIVPSSASLSVGQSQKFVAEVSDDAGNLLDPNAQDVWYLQWTSDGGIGKVDDSGYFAATAAGEGKVRVDVIGPWMSPQALFAEAKVSVSSTQTGIYCALKPSELTIAANADPQAFEVRCYDPNTPSAGPMDPEVMCPDGMDWSATIGSISANVPSISVVQTAAFTPGSVAGAGTVTAVGQLTTATVATSLISCSAPVTVTGGTISSMKLVPSSASIFLGDTQEFDAYGYDSAGNNIGSVSDSQLSWTASAGIGTIDGTGKFTATSTGSGSVKAVYAATTVTQVIEATAPVTVSGASPPGPGGNGGSSGSDSNSGGGSFATASTLSYTCSAEPGSLAVRILKPGATMVAEIWSVGAIPAQKVFTQSSSSDGTYSFSVPKSGDYEIRITADNNQRSVNFNMPDCTPATQETPKEITIEVKEPEVPKVPEQPAVTPKTTVTAVAPAPGIPAWALLLGAVLLLAAAYFLVFGKKKAPA